MPSHGTDPGTKLATAIGNVGSVMMSQGIPPGTSLEGYHRILANKRGFAADIRAVVAKHAGVESYDAQVQAWQKFYDEMFGIAMDLTPAKIPIRAPGFDSLGILARGIDRRMLLGKLGDILPVSVWNGVVLDHFVSDRTASNGPYAFFMRGDQYHDDKWDNYSAEQLHDKRVIGCTLEEWAIMCLRYYHDHKEGNNVWHQLMDVRGVTLCASTKDGYGSVLSVNVHGGSSFAVLCRGRRERDTAVGTREVILYQGE